MTREEIKWEQTKWNYRQGLMDDYNEEREYERLDVNIYKLWKRVMRSNLKKMWSKKQWELLDNYIVSECEDKWDLSMTPTENLIYKINEYLLEYEDFYDAYCDVIERKRTILQKDKINYDNLYDFYEVQVKYFTQSIQNQNKIA